MPEVERYSASAWVRPFVFSENNRAELRSRAGLSVECISRIEMVIENERGAADALSGEPSAAQVEAALDDGAAAAADLLKWLIQVDSKTRSTVDLSNFQRTDKLLSRYQPIIRELLFSIQNAKMNLPDIRRGRRPARFPLRLASVIADEIERDGHHVDATPNGPLCRTLGIALDAIERPRSKVSDIARKMLKERGN